MATFNIDNFGSIARRQANIPVSFVFGAGEGRGAQFAECSPQSPQDVDIVLTVTNHGIGLRANQTFFYQFELTNHSDRDTSFRLHGGGLT
jgi:hypothetical protein